MMTFSGRLIEAHREVPSIADIALSLSRAPRFGGHCLRWWSVLDHSFFVTHLAAADGPDSDVSLKLALLLHDAHESITCDIPSTMKTADMRKLQFTLDSRIMDAYYPGGHTSYVDRHSRIHTYDMRALRAEARVVGPPKLGTMDAQAFAKHFGGEALEGDVAVLRSLLDMRALGRADYIAQGVLAPNVREFVQLFEQLSAATREAAAEEITLSGA